MVFCKLAKQTDEESDRTSTPRDIRCIHDPSENYSWTSQNQMQSHYYFQMQASIHVTWTVSQTRLLSSYCKNRISEHYKACKNPDYVSAWQTVQLEA